MKRLAAARLWHEGNSFSPVATTLADFRGREWTRGAGGPQSSTGAPRQRWARSRPSPTRGARTRQVDFLRCAAANPAGPATAEAVAAIRAELLARPRCRPMGRRVPVPARRHGRRGRSRAGALRCSRDVRRASAGRRSSRRSTCTRTWRRRQSTSWTSPPATRPIRMSTCARLRRRRWRSPSGSPPAPRARTAPSPRRASCCRASTCARPTGPWPRVAAAASEWRARPEMLEGQRVRRLRLTATRPHAGAAAMAWSGRDGGAGRRAAADELAAMLRARADRFGAVRLAGPAGRIRPRAGGPRCRRRWLATPPIIRFPAASPTRRRCSARCWRRGRRRGVRYSPSSAIRTPRRRRMRPAPAACFGRNARRTPHRRLRRRRRCRGARPRA